MEGCIESYVFKLAEYIIQPNIVHVYLSMTSINEHKSAKSASLKNDCLSFSMYLRKGKNNHIEWVFRRVSNFGH